jgi:thioredoxin-like negative regulator of GroEL
MELTIDQVLQKAVEAHRAGKLQEAERLYRAILQAQPKHPDANHNLGVMAVSLNKTEAARIKDNFGLAMQMRLLKKSSLTMQETC